MERFDLIESSLAWKGENTLVIFSRCKSLDLYFLMSKYYLTQVLKFLNPNSYERLMLDKPKPSPNIT